VENVSAGVESFELFLGATALDDSNATLPKQKVL